MVPAMVMGLKSFTMWYGMFAYRLPLMACEAMEPPPMV